MEREKLVKMNKLHEAAVEELILNNVKHPGIIQLWEVIQHKRYIGFVLEICPYGDVFGLMRTINKHFELAKKKKKIMVYYLAQIVEVLSHLHERGIVHRDLKPENIVLAYDLKIRVIDFGTAKITNSTIFKPEDIENIERIRQVSSEALDIEKEAIESKSRSVSFVGTINYLSPEGINLNYSTKSDIWALGILAYKFYFNKLPYEGKDSIEIFKQIKVNNLPVEKDAD